jgi:hypothetical protein
MTTSLMSARARANSQRAVAAWGCGPVARKLTERLGNRVEEGPFAGLILTPMTQAEQIGPYLLGVYESELDDAWNIVFAGAYRQIVDIGAKFGYYAVGLANKYPDAAVVAFDTDWWARKAVREMAAANAAPNVEVRGYCTRAWLARNIQESAFIISDCEGFEDVLFGGGAIGPLGQAVMIIETHDCFVPGVSDRLRAVLASTHTVREFGGEGARRGTTRSLDFLSEPERRLAVQEIRLPQVWLLCLPKNGPNHALAQYE